MTRIRRLTPLAALLLAGACAASGSAPPAAPPSQPSEPAPLAPIVEAVSLESVGLDGTALDRSVSPCDDFYGFACGGWIERTEIPPEESRWYRSFNVIEENNQKFLRQILEGAESSGATLPATKQLGAYYHACMDEAAIEKAGVAPIEPLLAQVKTVRDARSLGAVIAALHEQGISPLFSFGSTQDFKDATRFIGEVDQGGLGLPDRDYYTKTDEKSVELRRAYRAHVEAMLALLGAPAAKAKQGAADVMRIETALATVSQTRVERRDPKAVYDKIDLPGVEAAAPHFPWKRYLEGVGFPKIVDINVTSQKFLKGMDQLLTQEKASAWQSYLSFHVVHAMAPALPAAFVAEDFKLRQLITGQKEIRPRWKRCVDSTDESLGELLAQPFVKEHFGGKSKEVAESLVHAIGAAFLEELGRLDWMDAGTRARAEQKFAKMAYLIGYPSKWRSYDFEVSSVDFAGNLLRAQAFDVARQLRKIGEPVDRGDWEMTPPTVNAYYNPQKNQMVFPAGILQPPFYSVTANIPVNLGAMGMVVGHELTHGFDDQGSQFDSAGNLADWWTPAVKQRFEAKTKCVAEQYAKYSPLPGVKLDGELTLGENIADLGGVKLAFAAYRALRRDAKSVSLADGFSEDQQFFLSNAQIWCAKIRDEYARFAATVDPHSPARFRVNGALSDLPEFAEAFSCKKGTPMSPKKACAVW